MRKNIIIFNSSCQVAKEKFSFFITMTKNYNKHSVYLYHFTKKNIFIIYIMLLSFRIKQEGSAYE